MALAEPRLAIATPRPREGLAEVIARQGTAFWIVAALLLVMPLIASPFWLVQILAYAMILGMIALSLMFLAGYGGIVSLVQMTVAAFAAYLVAIFGDSAITQISLKWPWWTAVPVAILLATLFGTLSGALSVRTEGIYTIMITLAIGSAFYYLALQNYTIFNGFSGFNGVMPPVFLGIDWGSTMPFYYLTLGCAALAYAGVVYVSRAPFGLALQGTRDNPRRMAALGFDVVAHRIAAYAFAAVIAAFAGVLLVWYQRQVSPGTGGVGPVVDMLIIAVVGGLSRPIGPFIGALVYVLLRTFALDLLDWVGLEGKRYQLLIGVGFLVIVLFSPDGLVGIWQRLRERYRKGREAQDAQMRTGGGAS
ncbi:branched-chain amino acid ABC transporter permease [Bosea sp. (in: a-proteobacteria)]|jgi:branched-chain amino acid transport system permease protein|uniref:branched-chain amino acid ABC transporter permease n=1 Tax=Bosea sp. (in: a-proteobacteria) TaxID=1871050 RepID=UPI002DDD26CE|nr:branched-chain amino acid ABC transporter permease [Bosea sp. (in: a-proteobacteria)]HEV2511540.1 branched-chain amino acid ABC transporter permease [Bosea sp. (in: a-proteobacteria)]